MFQILLGILVRYVKAQDYNLFAYLLHIMVAMGLVIFALYILLRSPGRESLITLLLLVAQVIAGIATVLTKIYLPVLFFHIAIGFLIVIWVSYLVAPRVLEGKSVVKLSQHKRQAHGRKNPCLYLRPQGIDDPNKARYCSPCSNYHPRRSVYRLKGCR